MGLWTIRGGNPLYGTVQVQGSKNAALALLAGCLVHEGVSVLERVPRVTDVETMLELLRCLDCAVKREGDRVTVDSTRAQPKELPEAAATGLRAAVLLLGAMAARFGEAAVPMPVGSRLGPRPVDLHIAGLTALGARIAMEDGMLYCRPSELTGGEVLLPYPSVGATENALLCACGCAGKSVIRGCAKEPEVIQLCDYLRQAGMSIHGAGTDTVTVGRGGAPKLLRHRLMPDRVAAATLLCMGAACGGELVLQEVNADHLQPSLDLLAEMGCNIKIRENALLLQSDGTLWSPAREVVTGPYPAFPTDVQPVLLAASLRADGVTILRERVLAGRLTHAKQLRRFGGDVSLTDDCSAVVTGMSRLQGACVEAHDVMGAAALLTAALQAEGESRIVDAGHTARGFAYLDAVLRLLGADLEYME